MIIDPQITLKPNNSNRLSHLIGLLFAVLRQRAEQYLTSSQTSFHFFRQAKGRLQKGQIFSGSSDFFIVL